ncbi:MBL fold metallo-hydrolase [Virgibacillus xinjiangensis]|uniref:MBL fold metallo-hydrolase n=1 Tax=Virgibacillus xinjiangensis TaxID=393090 RepID=A0ABV7CS11_9BACI
MEIHAMQLGPLGTNCYILQEGKEALVIDPGGDAHRVIEFMEHQQLKPAAILLTHAHFDHIGAVGELRKHYQIDVYLHEKEADWLEDPKLNGSLLFTDNEVATSVAEHTIKPGRMNIGSFSFEVLHTPGHSPGSVSFVFREQDRVFSGDVLFQRGIGRTDLPGGDFQELEKSIREKLYQLAEECTIYPGHGPTTAIGEEKRENPFVSTR